MDMASYRNRRAGDLIRELRVDAGLSPEALAHAIYSEKLGSISGRTIRRIEQTGAVPSPRVQFAIAQFFDRLPSEIWGKPRRKVAA